MISNVENKLSRNTLIELLRFLNYSEEDATTIFYDAKEKDEVAQLTEFIMTKLAMQYMPVCLQ